MYKVENSNLSDINYLFIGKYYAIFNGHFFDNQLHKHHAIQFCSNTNGDLNLSVENTSICGKGFLIAPNVPHKILQSKGNLFLLFLEPETIVGEKIINKYLSNEQFIPFNPSFFNQNLTEPLTNNKVYSIIEKLNKELDILDNKVVDSRIIDVIAIIKQYPKRNHKISALAHEIQLSESRMQHLFKEEIGISISQYLLWNKIERAIHLFQSSNNLTNVAYDAGFSDSAHFSRTFKAMFGVKPKELFKAKYNVKVVFL